MPAFLQCPHFEVSFAADARSRTFLLWKAGLAFHLQRTGTRLRFSCWRHRIRAQHLVVLNVFVRYLHMPFCDSIVGLARDNTAHLFNEKTLGCACSWLHISTAQHSALKRLPQVRASASSLARQNAAALHYERMRGGWRTRFCFL